MRSPSWRLTSGCQSGCSAFQLAAAAAARRAGSSSITATVGCAWRVIGGLGHDQFVGPAVSECLEAARNRIGDR